MDVYISMCVSFVPLGYSDAGQEESKPYARRLVIFSPKQAI